MKNTGCLPRRSVRRTTTAVDNPAPVNQSLRTKRIPVRGTGQDQSDTMQFTEEEKKMIAWLRQQHEGWRSIRIIILSCSVFLGGMATWFYFRVGYGAYPLVLTLLALYGAGHTLGSWSGRPEVSLLLKLVQSHATTPRQRSVKRRQPGSAAQETRLLRGSTRKNKRASTAPAGFRL